MRRYEFVGTFEAVGPGSAWTAMLIPPEVAAGLTGKARVAVKGTLNDHAFRSSLFPNGDGTFHMMINKAMQRGAGASQGDQVQVVLERDEAPRTLDGPPELQHVLDANPDAAARFERLSYSHRKEYADWIVGAKHDETRQRRAAKAGDMIAAGRRLKG
jgi:hypothetical protein